MSEIGVKSYGTDKVVYERFWTTASQEYGRFWEKQQGRCKSPLPDGTANISVANVDNVQANNVDSNNTSNGDFHTMETQREPSSAPYIPQETSREPLESQRDPAETSCVEDPPRGVQKQYTDEDLLKEVDFVGRAAKMAREGSTAENFPPKQPAVAYMERVQTRFWNAMNW